MAYLEAALASQGRICLHFPCVGFLDLIEPQAPLHIRMLFVVRGKLWAVVGGLAYLERGGFSPDGIPDYDLRIVIFEYPQKSYERRIFSCLPRQVEASEG